MRVGSSSVVRMGLSVRIRLTRLGSVAVALGQCRALNNECGRRHEHEAHRHHPDKRLQGSSHYFLTREFQTRPLLADPGGECKANRQIACKSR